MAVQYYNNYVDTTNFSDVCVQLNLATNAEQTFTVPGDDSQMLQAIFSYNEMANVFVGQNATVTVPSSGTQRTDQRVEYKPIKRVVRGGDILHFITPDTNVWMGVSFRALPSGQ